MASEDMHKVLREEIMKNDTDEVRKILNDHADIELNMKSGDKENLINVAIENADVEMLALLLGIQGPAYERDNVISDSKCNLVNIICDSKGNTPLLKAVQHGKVDMVSLLLQFGAEVNYFSERSEKAAIDLSTDPKILLELLKSDSKFPIDKEKSKELQKLISKDKGLSDFFKERDKVHELIKRGDTEAVKSVTSYLKMDSKRRMYFVNSQGYSILHTAIENKAFDTWASLKSLGMYYATEEEKNEEEAYEEMCEHALSKLLIPLEGCHLMKLLSKSVILNGDGTELANVKQYFDYLNEIDTTKTLMEVLQDAEGLQIAFDLESTNIEKLRPCSSDGERGITDFKMSKICAAAMRDKKHGIPEISSNLAHEMCHLAMHVVYGSYGLPYKNGDMERKREYEGVMKNIIWSTGCQKIISKVWEIYDSDLFGQELIVRVPEMMALYKISGPDFYSLLNEQEKVLVSYYENNVDPDLRKYIDSNSTSGRIFCRSLLNYQQLLSSGERIQVTENISNPIIGEHNNLKVLRASNVQLAQSHLKSFFKNESKDHPYFCDWSLYKQIIINIKEDQNSRNGIKECLKTGEIKKLVMTWDIDVKPDFCAKPLCTGNCPGSYFSEYRDCVYLLFSTEWSVLKNIKPNNYSWDDLSPCTKKMIQEKEVEFCGENVDLNTIISGLEGGDYLDKFMRECLDSEDISLLLGKEDIKLGKKNSFMDCRSENTILKHPEDVIDRDLAMELNGNILNRLDKDVFLVSDATMKDLCNREIIKSVIRQWNFGASNDPARCYILPPTLDVNEESVFQEVLEYLCDLPKGQVKTLHHLKLRQDLFAHIKSVNIPIETDLDKVKGLTFCADQMKLGSSDFEGPDPFLIADKPGTGKTTFLHSLPKKIKEYYPDIWTAILDLSLQTQQKVLRTIEEKETSSEKETLDILFSMVGSGSSKPLERKIFYEFCKIKNKIMVIFDGFDEICPWYKSVTTSFIVALRKMCGNIKLAVSTRLHEKVHLENALGVISHQLMPFNEDEQIAFLNEYWKELFSSLSLPVRKQKMSSSIESFEKFVKEGDDDGIGKLKSVMEKLLMKEKSGKRNENKLNFAPVAKRILSIWKPLGKSLDRFTETPLHLQMLGALLFEDSFKMNQILNIGHLYQRFFDLKLKIYNQDKVHSSGNVQSENLVRNSQVNFTKTLEKLSANLLEDKDSFEITSLEVRDACDIGLFSQNGEEYQFIHTTFAEFFYARRMLRKAGKKKMTKMWLEKIFVDNQHARVRKFLEDILHLFSETSIGSKTAEDFLMLKKATLNNSVIDHHSSLIYSIGHIVFEGSVYSLQYFADSFGEKVAKVLIQELDKIDDNSDLKPIFSTEGNTSGFRFNFLRFCLCRWTLSNNYITLVKIMLDLVKKYEMYNETKQDILTHGVRWLPYGPLDNDDDVQDFYVMRTKVVLNIFLEYKEIFGEMLREWITLKCDFWINIHYIVSLFTLHFDLLPLVMESLYDETQLKSVLSEEGIVSKVWIRATGECGLDETEQVWNYITKCLGMDATHLRNYLVWKDDDGCNALLNSTFNDDPEVIEFIWKLAGDMMDVDEKKKWLFDSFKLKYRKPVEKFLGWSFHKFLARWLNCGFLSGDEAFRLLKSEDGSGECYILNGYPYGFFSHVLPIEHHKTMESFVEEMHNVKFFSDIETWIFYMTCCPLNDHLKDEVDKIFEEVISRDTYGLADQIQVDESGFLVGVVRWPRMVHPDRFKFFVVAFYKQVEFCKSHFKEDGFVKNLKGIHGYFLLWLNVLHLVVFRMPALTLGYVSCILIDSLSRDDFLDLLFEPDEDGDTAFHIACWGLDSDVLLKSAFPVWNKLTDVVCAVLGQSGTSSNPNEKFFRPDVPVSRKSLEEHLAGWNSIWKSQKEGEQSEITLRQVTDEVEIDEDEGEAEKDEGREEEEIGE